MSVSASPSSWKLKGKYRFKSFDLLEFHHLYYQIIHALQTLNELMTHPWVVCARACMCACSVSGYASVCLFA